MKIMSHQNKKLNFSAITKFAGVFIFCLLSFFVFFARADKTDTPNIEKLMIKMDDLWRGKSSHGEIEMFIKSPHWERTLRMKQWSRGMDDSFIRITYPPKDKGTASLKLGNEMWNYLPKINKVMKIPPSMMMGSWMGSDFTNDDLVKESSYRKDYNYKLTKTDKKNMAHIELIPKPDKAVVWGKIVMIIDLTTSLPTQFAFYDEDGQKIRTMFFEKPKKFGDRMIPSVLRLVPHNKKDKYTIVKYINMEFDIEVSDRLFSLRALKAKR